MAMRCPVWSANQPVDPLDSKVTAFQGDGVLRTVVWAGRAGDGQGRGPNGRDTDWAIFFYKPYCGACKRVWPAFRAVAATTNGTGRLRFGEVNCVRDQRVCAMMGAEKQPLVRIYRAYVDAGGGGGGGGGGARKASQWCRESFLNERCLRSACAVRKQLREQCERAGRRPHHSSSQRHRRGGGRDAADRPRRGRHRAGCVTRSRPPPGRTQPRDLTPSVTPPVQQVVGHAARGQRRGPRM